MRSVALLRTLRRCGGVLRAGFRGGLRFHFFAGALGHGWDFLRGYAPGFFSASSPLGLAAPAPLAPCVALRSDFSNSCSNGLPV